MSEPEFVSVRLRGGPPYWAGKSLDKVYTRSELETAPLEALGTALIVPDLPAADWREEWEDLAPRALYGPTSEGDRYTWDFQGFFPSSPADPDPETYGR